MKEKHFLAYVSDSEGKAAINEETRTIRFIISSGSLDRDCEVVEPDAVESAIKDFSKNPVCLACHQHRLSDGMPPVVGSWDTESFKISGKRCEMDLRFAKTTLAEEYWLLYKDKHMRAVSIGFRCLDGHEVVENGKRSYIITKIELYEISCVPVGANRDALSKLKSFGEWDDNNSDQAKTLTDLIKQIIKDQIDPLRDDLDEIKTLLIPGDGEDVSIPDDRKNPPKADGQKIGQTVLTAIANGLQKKD
jgi:HK97 family phage prohead protease